MPLILTELNSTSTATVGVPTVFLQVGPCIATLTRMEKVCIPRDSRKIIYHFFKLVTNLNSFLYIWCPNCTGLYQYYMQSRIKLWFLFQRVTVARKNSDGGIKKYQSANGKVQIYNLVLIWLSTTAMGKWKLLLKTWQKILNRLFTMDWMILNIIRLTESRPSAFISLYFNFFIKTHKKSFGRFISNSKYSNSILKMTSIKNHKTWKKTARFVNDKMGVLLIYNGWFQFHISIWNKTCIIKLY